MPKDVGQEWTTREQVKTSSVASLRPAEFHPAVKEINISTESLHKRFKEVRRNVQTWGIISPSIMETINDHLPIENVIASDHGKHETISYNGNDSLAMERDQGLEQSLAATLDYHEAALNPQQVEQLALEYNLAHELGHALKAALTRKSTQNKLTHQGQANKIELETLFEESRREVDAHFLEDNPITEFGDTSNTHSGQLSKTSDERIAQSIALAYLQKALLKEGVDVTKAERTIASVVGGTTELYKDSISLTATLTHTDSGMADSTQEDVVNKHIVEAGYAFPISIEKLSAFANKIVLQTGVFGQEV